ncbi:hypothetical protein Leryth_010964 [Lithospermum erythrorhizon]|nr:hypothetical protein Leryth_010964 [Lithospermum erythrorhizon]
MLREQSVSFFPRIYKPNLILDLEDDKTNTIQRTLFVKSGEFIILKIQQLPSNQELMPRKQFFDTEESWIKKDQEVCNSHSIQILRAWTFVNTKAYQDKRYNMMEI